MKIQEEKHEFIIGKIPSYVYPFDKCYTNISQLKNLLKNFREK